VRDAVEYLAAVKAAIIMADPIVHWTALREEAQGDAGMFRFRLMLQDGSMLEVFEYFRLVRGAVIVGKYSYHWQDAAGRLRRRWDNAPHHRDVATQPHHVHDGDEANVLPHEPMTLAAVLAIVAAGTSSSTENR
jgi:hypothetical protein